MRDLIKYLVWLIEWGGILLEEKDQCILNYKLTFLLLYR